MKTQIITIITTMFVLTLVSAYYAGENITVQSDFELVDCFIIDNTYDLEGLNLSWEGKDIFLSTVPNFKPDTFSISCIVIKYKEEDKAVHYSFGSGSSSSSTTTTIEDKTEEVVDETNETTKDEIILDKEEKSYLGIWIVVSVLIVLIIIIVINRNSINKKNGEEITQNN